MMILLGYVLTIFIITPVFPQAPTVYYFCTENGDTRRLEFYVREDTADVTHVGAYEVNTNTSVGLSCDSTVVVVFPFPINPRREINGDGSASTPFHLSVSFNTQTDIVDPSCGYESTSASVYQFILQTTSDPTGSWDQQNVITCNFTNSATVEIPDVQASINVIQEAVTIVPLNDSYSFEFLDASQQPLTILNSNIVILKATFLSGVGIAAPVPDALGISPHTCRVCDLADCSGSYVLSMTDSNGCPINHFFYGHGFQGDGVTLLTSQAYIPNLHLHNDVYLVCINDYCTPTSGIGKCQDRCGALTGRKKRDVYNAQKRKSFYQVTHPSEADLHGKQNSSVRSYAFLMATHVVILIISIIVSIFQCNYFIKSKSKSKTPSEIYLIRKEPLQQL